MRLLPEAFFRDAQGVVSVLEGEASSDASAFLAGLWREAGGPPGSARHLKATVDVEGGRRFAIVELPAARKMGDPHFIGLAVSPSESRYFALERSVRGLTMLCEMTDSGRHQNYGEGPPVEKDAFATAVREKLGDPPVGGAP